MIIHTRPAATTTLLCTVGGSHEPIVSAIQSLQPDLVCFVCSDDDPATGSRGSYQQIVGKGNCIRSSHEDTSPTLPNIPAQTGLQESQYEIIKVDPDDFDQIFAAVNTWLAARNGREEQIVADYTGGTKTMSAALVAATLDCEHVRLQLVTGSRTGLVKVDRGSEAAIPASVERSKLQRQVTQALSLWRHFAYAEAETLLAAVTPPRDTQLRGQLQRARDLSRAFAAWDRFDHVAAAQVLENYRKILGGECADFYNTLRRINEVGEPQEPAQLFDLYLNAQRRAVASRYDDAVARLYRLVEWSAQWLLRDIAGIASGNVPVDKLPQGMELSRDRKGNLVAGLFQAWSLAAHHCGAEVEQFWASQHERLGHLLLGRNHSILAHGFSPLTAEDWQAFYQWTEQQLIPLLWNIVSKTKKYRLQQLPRQLPTQYPV